MAKPDDNADFEDLEEGAEGEEADTSTGAEEEAGEGDDTGADETGEDGGEGEGEGDDTGADDEFTIPEKFKGKEAKDIAKSYVELEKQIEKKAAEKAREMLGKNRPQKKDGEEDAAIKEAMKGVDFSKMKPEEFAAWLIKTVEARAQEIARNTYEAADSTKSAVQTEINTVTKTWPQLKENEGFRNMVLALIENKANKGEILTLKEACSQVGKALGQKPGGKPADGKNGAGEGAGDGKGKEGEGEGKPRPKTGVERPSGSGGGDRETDEEKVLAGLMGGKTPGSLGGLY